MRTNQKERIMQQKAFAIRDSKAGFFNQPFFQHSHGEAERSFKRLSNDVQSNISQFPEDFDLYYIGEYDNITGTITALETPQHMIKATALKT